jgi:hypothetical protein
MTRRKTAASTSSVTGQKSTYSREKSGAANPVELMGPIVIGGIGGSGTRVVAQMCMHMGFYLGSDLDGACDNLSFTFLLKRPRWFMHRASKSKDHVFEGLGILEKSTLGHFRPSLSELRFVGRAIAERVYARRIRRVSKKVKRLRWGLIRARKILSSEGTDFTGYVGWGWKEPNSHMYIEHVGEYFGGGKFIHVIRHGLDMAFSKNQNQLRNWAAYFEVDVPSSAGSRPRAALEFWIKANQRAVALGERMGRDRFLLLNFDQLCISPRTETERIIDFLGLDSGALDMDHLSNIPRVPASLGRYKECDLSIFEREAIDAVRELGFVVEA